jgi:hypothetical protein
MWSASNIKGRDSSDSQCFESRIKTISQVHPRFPHFLQYFTPYFKMYFSKIIQTALLLAISVPAQAWNRLDKENAVSPRELSLFHDQD